MILKTALYLTSLIIFNLGLLTSNSTADTMEDQVREISYLLMCPVCQGQTVEESNSDLARDIREVIRRKLQNGESKEEIVAYFVDRYGETILAAPPAKGTSWLLWLLPMFALAAGGIGIALFIGKSKGEKKKPEEAVEKPKDDSEGEYLEKLNKELKEFEP